MLPSKSRGRCLICFSINFGLKHICTCLFDLCLINIIWCIKSHSVLTLIVQIFTVPVFYFIPLTAHYRIWIKIYNLLRAECTSSLLLALWDRFSPYSQSRMAWNFAASFTIPVLDLKLQYLVRWNMGLQWCALVHVSYLLRAHGSFECLYQSKLYI